MLKKLKIETNRYPHLRINKVVYDDLIALKTASNSNESIVKALDIRYQNMQTRTIKLETSVKQLKIENISLQKRLDNLELSILTKMKIKIKKLFIVIKNKFNNFFTKIKNNFKNDKFKNRIRKG